MNNCRVYRYAIEDKLAPHLARNYLLKKTDKQTDFIGFFDDDVILPVEYFLIFKKYSNLGAALYGGANLSPEDSSLTSKKEKRIFDFLFHSYWCVGPFKSRYNNPIHMSEAQDKDLILCNLIIDFSVVGDFSFDSRLYYGEENALVSILKNKKNMKMLFFPDLYVWHERRSLWFPFLQQIYKYGLGRGYNLIYIRDLSFVNFFIVGIIAILLVLFVSIFLGEHGLYLSAYAALMYFIICTTYWLVKVLPHRTLEKKEKIYLYFLIPFVHISYFFGILSAPFSILNKKIGSEKSVLN